MSEKIGGKQTNACVDEGNKVQSRQLYTLRVESASTQEHGTGVFRRLSCDQDFSFCLFVLFCFVFFCFVLFCFVLLVEFQYEACRHYPQHTNIKMPLLCTLLTIDEDPPMRRWFGPSSWQREKYSGSTSSTTGPEWLWLALRITWLPDKYTRRQCAHQQQSWCSPQACDGTGFIHTEAQQWTRSYLNRDVYPPHAPLHTHSFSLSLSRSLLHTRSLTRTPLPRKNTSAS